MAPEAMHGVHEDVGDPGPERRAARGSGSAPARSRAPARIAHGVDAVDRGGGEVGIAAVDARHLVVEVLDRGRRRPRRARRRRASRTRGTKRRLKATWWGTRPLRSAAAISAVDFGHRSARRLLQEQGHAALEEQRPTARRSRSTGTASDRRHPAARRRASAARVGVRAGEAEALAVALGARRIEVAAGRRAPCRRARAAYRA